MTRPMSGLRRISGLALALMVAVATSGCVAAGLATGPLMSAVQLIGDRSVERTVSAELADAQGATEVVLVRLGFRIETRERDDDSRRLRAVAGGVTVHATLERVTTTLTRLALRVERGQMLADRDTSAQIHDQIAALLTPPVARTTPADPAAAEALATLHSEVHKLRSDIEARRSVERAVPARETGATIRLEPGAVVTVPLSAALPTVGGPAPTVSVPRPAAAVPPSVVESTTSRPEPGQRTHGASTPLHPAGALTPIQAAVGVEGRN